MKFVVIFITGLLFCSNLVASRFTMSDELVVKTSPYILIAKFEAIDLNEVTAKPVRVLKGSIEKPQIKIRFPDDRPLRLSSNEHAGGSYLIYLDPTDNGFYTFHPYRLSSFQKVSDDSITSAHDRKLIPLKPEIDRINHLIKTPLHILLSDKTEQNAEENQKSNSDTD